jgi:hypothetical protein
MIETKTLAQIVEMGNQDNKDLLRRIGYGHLGCSLNGRPYVVPIHYAYDEPYIYFFTTEGKKTDIIRENREVCLQVEDVVDSKHWQSVIVTGEAELLTTEKEADRAMDLIKATNPTLSPAWSIRWMDQWIRKNVSVIYRITPSMITGRMTVR